VTSPTSAAQLDRPGRLGWLATTALVAVAGLALLWRPPGVATATLVLISGVAFGAMATGAWLGHRSATELDSGDAAADTARRLVWGYGLASGAMITSAALFLLPGAIAGAGPAAVGGIGVAVGLLAGFAAHTLGHRLSHAEPFDDAVLSLAAHSLAGGAVIGFVYAANPSIGALLGVAIVSHKGPAGYASARRLTRQGRSPAALLLPAAGVGLTAIPVGLAPVPNDPAIVAGVFGFAAGAFLHVAMDFLPRCGVGEEVHAVAGEDHALLDRLRVHATLSTAGGAAAVILAWAAVGG
jgi:ZIP family zinc transporter